MASFVDNLRASLENAQLSAKSAARGTSDTPQWSYFIPKLEYATEDDVEKASGMGTRLLKSDKARQKTTWNYTPIAWSSKDGKQKDFGYLVTDDGSFGNKVFGIERSDGSSMSPDGAKKLINDIQNGGGAVKIRISQEQVGSGYDNPLQYPIKYDTEGYGTFKTGRTERGRQNLSDSMTLLKNMRSIRRWE